MVIGLVLIGSVAWYLGSPLFIDDVVEEEFPAELVSQMEQLTAEQVDAMPEKQRTMMQEKMEEVGKMMPDTVMEDTMPEPVEEGPSAIASGQFKDADSFHKGSGTATLYALPDGTHLLRFEDFSVTNGPALSVFLTDDAGQMTSIGTLKGNKGNQNYPIPSEIDVSAYSGVLIYCVPFKVPFASARLTP